jgi:hypothetical protein
VVVVVVLLVVVIICSSSTNKDLHVFIRNGVNNQAILPIFISLESQNEDDSNGIKIGKIARLLTPLRMKTLSYYTFDFGWMEGGGDYLPVLLTDIRGFNYYRT